MQPAVLPCCVPNTHLLADFLQIFLRRNAFCPGLFNDGELVGILFQLLAVVGSVILLWPQAPRVESRTNLDDIGFDYNLFGLFHMFRLVFRIGKMNLSLFVNPAKNLGLQW